MEGDGASIAAALVASLAALAITLAVVHVVSVAQRRRSLPPGPWPWPVAGNLFLLRGVAHRNLHEAAKQFGGLMYIQLGEKPCLVVSSAAVAKDLFRTHDAAFSSRPKRLLFDILTAGTYRSLPVAPYGPLWRQLRRLVNTRLFSPAVHASHQVIRNGEVQNMMKTLVEEAKQGRSVDLKTWLTGATSNNMTMMLTNNRFFDIRDPNQEKRHFEEVLRSSFDANSSVIISDYIPSLKFITKLQGWEPHLVGIRNRGRQVAHKIIDVEKHRQRAESGLQDESHVPDFVDVLLKAPLDDGKPLNDGDITSLTLGLLNAGTDTSATTAEWAMAELVRHPDIQKRAQAELDAVVGHDRLVVERDIPELPFLTAIVKETFRLHPAAPLSLPRECHEACEFAGWRIPADTQLIMNVYAIHRDPSVWGDSAALFEPDRFLAHPEINPLSGHDHFELSPFGFGRRMCPGSHLAFSLVSLMLASLLHSFDWSLPDGRAPETLDMTEAGSFILLRASPLRLVAKPRAPASLY